MRGRPEWADIRTSLHLAHNTEDKVTFTIKCTEWASCPVRWHAFLWRGRRGHAASTLLITKTDEHVHEAVRSSGGSFGRRGKR